MLCSKIKYARSPKVSNYEIQKLILKKVSLSGHPEAKVSRLRHQGALGAQP